MEERSIMSGFVNPPFRRRIDIEDFIKNEFLIKPDYYPEHEHLNYSTMHVYIFESSKAQGYDKYGKIRYVRDDLVYTMTGVDFVLLLNEEIWDAASTDRRKAIIDHFFHKIRAQYQWEDPETQKIAKGDYYDVPKEPGIDLKFQVSKTGRIKWKIVKPIGEFPEIIRRYGGWNVDVKDLENSFIAKEKNQS